MQRSIGAYDIEAELGRGGMGRVLRARHRPTGAVRAIKVLDRVDGLEVLDRFRREAETIARAGGEGVVAIHEAGVEGGHLYLVMNLMSGGSLKGRIAKGALPWREAVSLIIPIARALERCHAAGIVHRDVKPDNILLDDRGCAQLADFGLARDLAAESLTATGTVLGTPHYMAPEALNGFRVDGRADVYSLAVTLYEVVTGERPYEGGSHFELLRSALQAKRRPVHEVAPDAPLALDAILARALAGDRMKRTAGAEAFAAELEDLLAGRTTRRARWPWALAATVLASLVFLGGVLWTRRPRSLPVQPMAPRSLAEALASVSRGQGPASVDALERIRAAASGPEAVAAIAQLGSAIDDSGSIELRRIRADARTLRHEAIFADDLAAVASESPSLARDLAVAALANGVEGRDVAATLVRLAHEHTGDVAFGLLAAVTLLSPETVRPEDRTAAREILAALPKESMGPDHMLLLALRDMDATAAEIEIDIVGRERIPHAAKVTPVDRGHACNALADDPLLGRTRAAVLAPLVPPVRMLIGLTRGGGGFGEEDVRVHHALKAEESWQRLAAIATPEGSPLALRAARIFFTRLADNDLATRATNMEAFDRLGRALRGKDDLVAATVLVRSAEISTNLRRAPSPLAWSPAKTLENALLAVSTAKRAHEAAAPGSLERRWAYFNAHAGLGFAATARASVGGPRGDDEANDLFRAQIACAREELDGAREGNTEESADVRRFVRYLLHRKQWDDELVPDPPPYALPEVLCLRACKSAVAGDVARAKELLADATRANAGRAEPVKDWDDAFERASELVDRAR